MFCVENNEKIIRCHLEGLSNSEIPVKISCSKCKNCSNVMEQKSYCASAKRDLYRHSLRSTLKMTDKALSLLSWYCASKKQKKSSLVQRKPERQAIFKFVLSSASGGAGGGKYNRIPAFVSMSVLLIRRSLEFFRVPRKNRDDRFCFGFAKVLAHTFFFSLITISESISATWNCGEIDADGNYGSNVKCSLNNGIFTISGSGKMADYSYYTLRPWNNAIRSITKVIAEDTITGIGNTAFLFAENLVNIDLPGTTSIGNQAFQGATNLTEINMPNIKTIGSRAFQGAQDLISVDMPNIESIGTYAFGSCPNLSYVGLQKTFVDENGNINNVSIGQNAFVNDAEMINCYANKGYKCGTCNDYIKTGTGCFKDCGAGYLGKEGRCIDASNGCGAGYRQFENFCNRIRYTPAEAAQVLTDDNNNSVTITFRK